MRFSKSIAAFATILLAAALGVSGCGEWQPPAPTGPTGFGEPPAHGAVVTGTVNGAQGVTSLTAAGIPNMTVSVAGTRLVAAVGISGRFVLTDVPLGTITLQFTAPGVAAFVQVHAVKDREQIDIKVTIRGTGATIDSTMRIEPNDEIEIEGEVERVTGTCPSLVIVVHGTALSLNGSTHGACNDLRVGMRVRIKGHRSSGTMVIDGIEFR